MPNHSIQAKRARGIAQPLPLLVPLVGIVFSILTAGAAAADNDRVHPIGIFIDLHRVDFRKEPIERWIRTMQGLKGLGFDTAVVNANEAMLDQATLLDFQIVTYANFEDSARSARFEAHPSLLAWYGIDEPGRVVRLEEARRQYAKARETTTRPLAVSLYLPSAYPEANALADILLPDPYIFGHVRRDGTFYGITEVAERIGALKRELEPGKRLWAVPQLYAWHPYFKRPPTPDELEAQTMLCLGEGAEGILYFALNSGQYYPHPPHYESVTEGEKPTPWALYDHPGLLDRLRKMNKITRHVFAQFDAAAEKESLPDGSIRYTWRRGTDSFTAEVRTRPRLHVEYSF